MSHWQKPASIFDFYTTQRQKMMLDRLRLQAQIMLIVGLTVIAFFLWVNLQAAGKISALKIGLVVELIIGACWFLCQNNFGRRYPQIIFLTLCWSVTCIAQIGTALLFNVLEPRNWIKKICL